MARKPITIREETYKRLLQLKYKGETLDGVLMRLMNPKQDVSRYFGLLADEDGDKLEQEIDDARKKNDVADLERIED